VLAAPDLFEADDMGFGQVIGDGSINAEQVERAKLAVNNCPEYAVELIGQPGGAE
jgi:ferredoxin